MLFLIVHPEWRNWQTRWTQNPVVLSTVWVRPPPPGPFTSFVQIRFHTTVAPIWREPADYLLPQKARRDKIYTESRSFDASNDPVRKTGYSKANAVHDLANWQEGWRIAKQ